MWPEFTGQTTVNSPTRAVLAKEIGTIDTLSGGRFELGIAIAARVVGPCADV